MNYNNTPYLDAEIEQLIKDYKSALEAHKCTGNLLNSITTSQKWSNDKYTLSIEGLDYGIFLENGTKPHFPPVDEILKWVRIKPVLPRQTASGKLPTDKQLAFLIGRKISRVGTEATHSLSNTIENNNYAERIALAVAKELTKEFDNEHIKDLFAPTHKRN